MKKVIIASKNPVKINAVKLAFEKYFNEDLFIFEGIEVFSEVSDQPLSDLETYNGANNRVNNAMKEILDADYYVGIEGGIEKKNDFDWEVFAWIVIKSKNCFGKSRTSTFYLAKGVIELIEKGYELGHASDIFFKTNNIKQNSGSIGILTDNLIDRTNYYVPSVILALIPFKKNNLYEQ
ncbi:non-canonical purine NTP phosphatase [bacterium]|nr:non-canonical purine NTP phosphatase [bacterium]